ncbi:TPA: phage protein NinX family protein [Serratia marcescens]
MTDYSKMSDFEINKGVAERLGYSVQENRHLKDVVEIWRFEEHMEDAGDKYHGIRNYCNNPADAWPIIVANEIGVVPSKSSNTYAWDLSGGILKGIKHVDDNPLRAAMIVFLMMKDAEKC